MLSEKDMSHKHEDPAPHVQEMAQTNPMIVSKKLLSPLDEVESLIIEQSFEMSKLLYDIFAIPYLYKKGYSITSAPSGNLVGISEVKSDIFPKCCLFLLGCDNLAPKTYEFVFQEKETTELSLERECTLGGVCCMPHKSHIKINDSRVGFIQEDFSCLECREDYRKSTNRCFQHCCLCTNFHEVHLVGNKEDLELSYLLEIDKGCCRSNNNWCAPSPCKPKATYDLMPTNGDSSITINHVMKEEDTTWLNCAKCCTGSSNFVLDFPPNTDSFHKAAILSTLMHLESIYFDKSAET